MTDKYTVRTRYGWGWEVIGPEYQSLPIQSALAAQAYADARNEGLDHVAARKRAGLRFDRKRGRLIESYTAVLAKATGKEPQS